MRPSMKIKSEGWIMATIALGIIMLGLGLSLTLADFHIPPDPRFVLNSFVNIRR